jgi:glycosyltransferase involved in cell wall biosynthesis
MTDKTNVYIGADTGGSGFGVAAKGLAKQLIKNKDFNVTLRTHSWGWNKEGHQFDQSMGDQRFKHFIWNNGYVNEDYIADTSREVVDRKNELTPLTKDLKSSQTVDSKECMVKQFEGKEDVWIGIGGQNFAEHAPDDEDIHTILSTDFNLDKVPRDWEHYLSQVDEVWVPSEWTYNSIKNRFEDSHPEIVDKTHWMHYGINMEYRPTEYDCVACPGNRHQANPQQPNQILNQPCLKDDKFNFVVVSRFYHIKGVYRTIKAFIKEFRGEEPVRLMFKTTSNNQFQFDPAKSIQSVIQELQYPDPPEIGIKKEHLNTQHLYDLYGQADTFIQASRAECFGIAQLEAAYCGTPVIYTDWSSQREVMDEEVEGMIPLKEYELQQPKQESQAFTYAGADDYPVDSQWAVPDVEVLGDKMREMFETSEQERQEMGEANKQYVEENYKWSEKAEKRINRIKEAVQ